MITVDNLSKYFGSHRALGPVSFEIENDECVGFLGLNGAGKTTALRVLACDLRPSSGTVSVGGVDVLANPHEVRKRVGYLPENTPLYLDMTVSDYVRFAGRLRGMASSALAKRLPKVLEVTDITEVRNDLIRNLSHGYKQRVGVAQAIVHEPDLLILDEPTRGLDPVQIVEMRNMVQQLKKEHTVLISTHILTEISQTCDRLLVLGNGEIIASGTEDALSSNLIETKRIEVAVQAKSADGDSDAGDSADEAPGSITTLIEQIDGVASVSPAAGVDGSQHFEIACSDDVRAQVCRTLVEAGHDVVRLVEARSELESTFLRLVKGGQRARS